MVLEPLKSDPVYNQLASSDYKHMQKVNILGVNLTRISRAELIQEAIQYLKGARQHYIVTPNPEILLLKDHDEELYYILNKADIALPDGTGLKFAAFMCGANLNRITGADFTKDLFGIANNQKYKVAIANWKGSISNSSEIKKSILNDFPGIDLLVVDIERDDYRHQLDHRAMHSLAEFNPTILLTNLGAPYQEKFIFHVLHKLPSIKIGMGIGGSLDFLTGKIKRAPKWMRISGIEWLYRLVQEPWRRWKRILNAVIIFPLKFLSWRFILPYLYRANVSCILFKKVDEKYHILIVERTGEPGHWQLPQGGLDRLSIVEAGRKELTEELNSSKFKSVASFKDIHKYDFINYTGKYCAYSKYGYKGQIQSLYIAKFLGNDEDIRINFWDHSNWKWVEMGHLADEVFPNRKKATELYLEKFRQIISNS
jgi:N-acetylglucosaminyldiphosphoundecaprenol N-acetyl-beta-D-mannosaminyltransferase